MRRVGTILLLLLAALPATRADAAPARGYVVSGYGWGHGVGMSQYGAQGFALHGWKARRILAHYYPGTRLARFPPRRIRVLLQENRNAVGISSRSSFLVRDARGWRLRLRAGRWRVGLDLRVRRHNLRAPLRFVPGRSPLVLGGRGYRGDLVVHFESDGLAVVNALPLERYLRGVVPWEMPWYWERAALRAQAVAARSYALAVGRQGLIYDVVSTTADQVYGGIEAEHPSTNRAIGATTGLVVTWKGEPALTYYSSTSGGRTEASADAFPRVGALPYLLSVPDPYDSISPHHRWGPLRFKPRTLAERLGVPKVDRLALHRNGSGRVATLTVAWGSGRRTFSGGEVEQLLRLPSTWFAVRALGGKVSDTGAPVLREHGYLAVLATLQAGSSPSRTLERVRARVPGARAVDSSAYPALRPGFVVICAGPYAKPSAATEVAARVQGAYVRRV